MKFKHEGMDVVVIVIQLDTVPKQQQLIVDVIIRVVVGISTNLR